MAKAMKTITRVTEGDLVSWLRPYGKILIKHFFKSSKFLKDLGWDVGSREAKRIIFLLFGVSFKQARGIYTDGFLSLEFD
ncbi:MAG: hypothetical protein ACFFEN_05905 [Candidatus Thorarchaeota archaeon]